MRRNRKPSLLAGLGVGFLAGFALSPAISHASPREFNPAATTGEIPAHVYLTWDEDDTAHSMTVNFHSPSSIKEVTVHYDIQPRGGDLSKYAFTAKGTSDHFRRMRRRIHKTQLSGLSPATAYFFTLSDGNEPLISERKFQTLPLDGADVRFVSGGDNDTGSAFDNLNTRAALKSPMFALLGGDLAYDNGILVSGYKVDAWLKSWVNRMVTPDGITVPMILVPGNHEVMGGYKGGIEKATFFGRYFIQEKIQDKKLSYFSRKIGRDLVIYGLDSGHIYPISGAQTLWLKGALKRDAEIPLKVAFYHVPMYPSVRDFTEQPEMEEARTNWLPLFDEHELTVAFENHEHSFKRSKILKNGAVSPKGTLYLGDGAWGRKTRDAKPDRWYLEKASGLAHFWYAEKHGRRMTFEAINPKGNAIDRVTLQR